MLLAEVDHGSLLPQLAVLLVELSGDEESEPDEGTDEGEETGIALIQLNLPAGELTGLVTDGATARGTVDDKEVHFVEVDGRWYLAGLPAD